MSNFTHKPINLDYELSAQLTEAGRLYKTPEGNYYPSVTTFLGHFTSKSIEGWKNAVGEKEANRVGHHAITRGNAVHNTAERYLNNEDNYMVECVMPHVRQMWRSLKSVLDEKVDNIIMQECPLYSDKLLLAGRVDLIAEFDGVLSIVDFKTSSRVKSKDEITSYYMQECAYALMFEEQTGIAIDQLVTVMVVEGTNQSLIFTEDKKDWVDKLKRKRDEYFAYLRENVKV